MLIRNEHGNELYNVDFIRTINSEQRDKSFVLVAHFPPEEVSVGLVRAKTAVLTLPCTEEQAKAALALIVNGGNTDGGHMDLAKPDGWREPTKPVVV